MGRVPLIDFALAWALSATNGLILWALIESGWTESYLRAAATLLSGAMAVIWLGAIVELAGRNQVLRETLDRHKAAQANQRH